MFDPDGLFVGDVIEEARLGAMQPAASPETSGLSWWEKALSAGLTRGIDSHFATREIETALDVRRSLGVQGADGYTYRPGVYPNAAGAGIPMSWILIGGAVLLAVVVVQGMD